MLYREFNFILEILHKLIVFHKNIPKLGEHLMHYALIISVVINFLLVISFFYSNKIVSGSLTDFHQKIKEQDKLIDSLNENVKDILLLLAKQNRFKNAKNGKYTVDLENH